MIKHTKKEYILYTLALLSVPTSVISGLIFMVEYPHSSILILILFPLSTVVFGTTMFVLFLKPKHFFEKMIRKILDKCIYKGIY